MFLGEGEKLTLKARALLAHLAKAGGQHYKVRRTQACGLLDNREYAWSRDHDKGQVSRLRQIAQRFIGAFAMHDLAVRIDQVDRAGEAEVF